MLTCHLAEGRARLASLGLVLDTASEGADELVLSAGEDMLPQLSELLSKVYLAEEVGSLENSVVQEWN